MSKSTDHGAAIVWVIFVPGVISAFVGSIAGALFFGAMAIAVSISERKE